MKKILLIPAVTVLTLAGCAQLSPEDHALVTSASQAAEEAKQQSVEATEEARRAREDANRAAEAAQAASDKADRIFRQGQNK